VSFREAKALATQLRLQNDNSKFAQAVINNSTNGLILINSEGVVIDYNGSARSIWGTKPEAIKGKNVADVPWFGETGFLQFKEDTLASTRDEVRKVHGEAVLCKWIDLAEKSGAVIGAVGIFQKMSDIMKQQYEYQKKQKRESIERGFAAKMALKDILGSSAAIRNAKAAATLFAQGDANILITGPTGVGKEIFSQAIHNMSARKSGPFLAINCAALPEALLESELFGYDEGAFTGSKRGGKKGFFELADKGTIFLDEIGELSPALQSRLLRVLQEREIMRVGGDRVIPVDVRVISATNKNLEHPRDQDKFRRDLYYRLSVLELRLPPLSERGDDVVELFEHFLRQRRSLHHSPDNIVWKLAPIIKTYTWKGNVRELQNVAERFTLFLGEGRGERYLRKNIVQAIGEERLLEAILEKHGFPQKAASPLLLSALKETLGLSKARIGEVLGMSRTTLWRKNKENSGFVA
jgi:propionate catabolism operon transcriptional regulator